MPAADTRRKSEISNMLLGDLSFDDDFLETKAQNHEGEWIMVAFTVSLPWLIDEGIISRCAMILLQRSQNIDALELEKSNLKTL